MPDLIDVRPPLRAFILGAPAVAALVAARMYPLRLPQGTQDPSIVYTRISGVGDHTMEGASGLAQERVQIDAWAATIDVATQLANAIKSRIDGYRGQMVSTDPAITAEVSGVFFDSGRENFDDEAKLYRVSRDYRVVYQERAP